MEKNSLIAANFLYAIDNDINSRSKECISFDNLCYSIFSYIDGEKYMRPGFSLIKKGDSVQNDISGLLSFHFCSTDYIIESKLDNGQISLEEFNFFKKVNTIRQEYGDEYCQSNPRDVANRIFAIIDEEYELYPRIYDKDKETYQVDTSLNIASDLFKNWNQKFSMKNNQSKEMITKAFLNTVNDCVDEWVAESNANFESICYSIFLCIDGSIGSLPGFILRKKGDKKDIGGGLASSILQNNETIENNLSNGYISLEEFDFLKKIKSLKQECDDEYCQTNPRDVVNKIFEIIDLEYELYQNINDCNKEFYKTNESFFLNKVNIAGDLSKHWSQMLENKSQNFRHR